MGLIESDENHIDSDNEHEEEEENENEEENEEESTESDEDNRDIYDKKRKEEYIMTRCKSVEIQGDMEEELDDSHLKRTRKKGKRIQMVVDSDDEDDFVNTKIQTLLEKTTVSPRDWCKTFTNETLPEITFSFGIDWEIITQVFS